MKLIALVTEPKSIVRYLTKLGEPIDVPARSTSRGPPYWKSTVLRRKAGRDSKRLNAEHSAGADPTRFVHACVLRPPKPAPPERE
jgi:hypothetical protein